MGLKIKKEYAFEVIGFNNSSKPLGQRNDLHVLYDIARKYNPGLLKYFEEFPTDKEVDKMKVDAFNIKRKNKTTK